MEEKWKKIDDSSDAMCFERTAGEVSVRLEARNTGSEWVIYRGYYSGGLNYTEEYAVPSIDDAKKMIFQLKGEQAPSVGELQLLVKKNARKSRLSFRRGYRDESSEKWFFSVDDGSLDNFFTVREDECIEMDIVLNDRYRSKSDFIINEIMKMLSLDNAEVVQSVYYFTKSKKQTKKMRFEFDVDFISDD